MIDLVKLKLMAGDGGNGRISLRREKYVPKGGPDGGDGGYGGSIILRGNKNINTLKRFAGAKEYIAANGQEGGKNNKHGAKGENLVLEVPLGTVVWLAQENAISQYRRRKYQVPLVEFEFEQDEESSKTEAQTQQKTQQLAQQQSPFRLNLPLYKDDVKFEKYFKDWDGNFQSDRTSDEIKAVFPAEETVEAKQFNQFDKVLDSDFDEINTIKLVEILADQEEVIICQGGFGGRGNHAFRSSMNQTPLEAEFGTYGEKKEVILELRLLADLGLVGLPNAGKSTLLSRLTKAHPKIADYPFTTIEPNLGIMISKDGQKELVVADIPGLIEKASLGKGLGITFLRHIENCQALMYVLFLEEHQVFEEKMNDAEKAAIIWQQYQILQQELGAYSQELLHKPSVVTLNKIDLYPETLIQAISKKFKKEKEVIVSFSSATGKGLDEVKEAVFNL